MKRIAIIGCGGAGKSTLAREMGRLLALPVHHLDRLFWKPGWVETARDEWQALHVRLCAEPAWIIDGNYGGTLELRLAAADTVIFLDLPTRVCLWRVVRRFLKYRGRSRPDMSSGCPEKLGLAFLWWIFTYRKGRRPAILERLGRSRSAHAVVQTVPGEGQSPARFEGAGTVPQKGQSPARIYVLRSTREIACFLQALCGSAGA